MTQNLEDLLIGRRIVSARISDIKTNRWSEGGVGVLTLDNGVTLHFSGVEDCCSSWDITSVATTDNIITAVECVDDEEYEKGEEGAPTYYKIFVLAGDERINILECDGSPGNYPYYATGWYLDVVLPEEN